VLCERAREAKLEGLEWLLLSGADPTKADYDGRTALHVAAGEGNKKIVQLLVKHGGRVDVQDRWGNTPKQDAERGGFGSWPPSIWDSSAQTA